MLRHFSIVVLSLTFATLTQAVLPSTGWSQDPSSPEIDVAESPAPSTAQPESGAEPAESGAEPSSATEPSAAEPMDRAAAAPVEEIELTDEEKALIAVFEADRVKLAELVGDMRAIYVRTMNGVESSGGVVKYREIRNAVREQFNATYQSALAIIRQIPHEEAVSFIATWVQHRETLDIYDRDTFEGAARLIDGGVNYMFLFLAGARSAVVSGDFKQAKMLFEAMDKEKLEKHDQSLFYQLEELEKNWKQEQEALKADAEKANLPQVRLVTTRGEVVVELFLDDAPQTVANFISLVEDGFYDGLEFYQVVDHLLALTGDPSGNGSGSTGKFVPDEHDRPNRRLPMRGSLVMAKLPMGEAGEFVPNSGSSQFAILFLPLAQPMDQTIFGRVIQGMDVVSSLRRVDPHKEKKKNEVQVPPDRILTAEVIRRPETLPEVHYVNPGGPAAGKPIDHP